MLIPNLHPAAAALIWGEEILGRTVVIHSGTDDLHAQPAENPGIKIACGVICRA